MILAIIRVLRDWVTIFRYGHMMVCSCTVVLLLSICRAVEGICRPCSPMKGVKQSPD